MTGSELGFALVTGEADLALAYIGLAVKEPGSLVSAKAQFGGNGLGGRLDAGLTGHIGGVVKFDGRLGRDADQDD